jgi:hypothetical protein
MLGRYVRFIVSAGLERSIAIFDKYYASSHLFLHALDATGIRKLGLSVEASDFRRWISPVKYAARAAMNRWYKNSLPEGRPFRLISGDQLPSGRGPCRHRGRDLS